MMWRKLTAAVVTVSLLGGCFVGSPRTRYAVNGTILGAGIIFAGTPLWNECPPADNDACPLGDSILQVTGAIVAAIAVIALVHTGYIDPPKPPGPSDEAIRLLDQARIAARLGHCENVHAIADRVAVIDPAFRAHEFADDSDIHRCMP